jgi:hypothetical protein
MAEITLAWRLGVKRNEAKNRILQPTFDTYSTGLGLSPGKAHFIDLSYEIRDVDIEKDEQIQLGSVSYSYLF